jgi:hypothetical protein
MKKVFYTLFVLIALAIFGIALISMPKSAREGRMTINILDNVAASYAAESCGEGNITKTADYIIEGVVQKVDRNRLEQTENGNVTFTYVDFAVEKYIKGTPFTGNSAIIKVPENTALFTNSQIFSEGKKLGIYLEENNGKFLIHCGNLGVKEL